MGKREIFFWEEREGRGNGVRITASLEPMKQIAEVGNEAPYFAAKGQHGRVIRLNNYIGKMNLVMFFMKDTGAKSVVQALEFNEWVGYFHQGHCAGEWDRERDDAT